ncbi:AI-2E family transporter [Microbacterium sp.]|uniref:AI-2E family transporter n=1 Tax=Microbacterium sp. TaxID=51671 RepID=UPI003C162CD7
MSELPPDPAPAPDEPAVPPRPAPERKGILALIERPMIVAFIATLGVLGGLVIGSGIASITTVIIYIVLALFVALALDPLVRLLQRRGMKRGTGIGIVFGAFAILAALFFVFLLPPILSQVGAFVRNLPEAIAGVVDSDWFLALSPDLQDAVAAGLDEVAVALAQPETIAAIGGGALALGVGLVSAISAGFIVVALTLYFLSSLSGMKEALYSVAPARDRPTLSGMTERVTASVGKSLLGSVTLALINAGVVFVLQLVIGLPYPALMAFIALIITLVPLFGSVIFLVIGTLAALLSSPEQALIFGIAYLIYIQIEAYVVTPRVMTKAIAIPAALVLIGAMVGGTLGGVIGVLVALPVMASILLVIREIVVPRQDRKV